MINFFKKKKILLERKTKQNHYQNIFLGLTQLMMIIIFFAIKILIIELMSSKV